MPPPCNKAELETILGRFAPKLSETTDPLRQLLKDGTEFVWDSHLDVAVQQVKDLLTREPGPALAYFDHTEGVKLQVDASKCG